MKKGIFLFFAILAIATLNIYAQNQTIKLVGKSTSGNLTDETVVIFNPAATAGLDQDLDVIKKMSGSDELPMIYTLTINGDSLAINSLPALDANDLIVKLNYDVKKAGTYNIRAILGDFVAPATQVYLIDAKTNTTQNLKVTNSYNFQINPGEGAGRFTLLFTSKIALEYYTTDIMPWSAVVNFPAFPGADGYTIRYAPVGTNNWKYRKTTTNSFKLEWLTSNTNYYWQVVVFVGGNAINSPDNSGELYSNQYFFKTDPSLVMNLHVSNITKSAATIIWDGIPSAANYKVRFEPKGTTTYRWKKTTSTSTRVRQLTPGTTYTVQVKANFGSNRKPYCQAVEFTTLAPKMMNSNVDFSITPNPATNFINVNISDSQSYNAYITDLAGRTVFSGIINGNQDIDISNLNKGMYMLNINNKTVKFIVE
ncbi:MAG: T9SS type A sorting domain-containing protein [Bacteroidales bacterium]|nr:T9SS type A sorting domain-containing protein [Bacteroidales bacterium]